MDFKSEWVSLKGTTEQYYSFFRNLNNLEQIMPEQIINWKSDEDHCSFTIKGMTDLALNIEESVTNKFIRLVPEGKTPFEFYMIVHFRENDNLAESCVQISADLNPMFAMIAKRPLQNLVEIMADRMAALEL